MSRQTKILLNVYRLFLLGEEVALQEFPDAEIQKAKTFHERLLAGHAYYATRRALCLPESIARGLWLMFCDFQEGKPIRDLYHASRHPKLLKLYPLVLSGISEHQLRADGYTDFEIEQVNLYRQFENADMLPVTISQKTGILVSTVKNLQKLYRDNQKTNEMPEMPEIPIAVGVVA